MKEKIFQYFLSFKQEKQAGNEMRASSVSNNAGYGSSSWFRTWFPQNQDKDIMITEDSSMGLTAVYACVKIIANSIAQLPIHIKQDGVNVDYDYRYDLIKNRPNPQTGRFTFIQTLVSHKLLWGNAYVEIIRNAKDNKINHLRIIHPALVRIRQLDNGDLVYHVNIDGQDYQLPFDRIIHFRNIGSNGLIGDSTIAIHRETLSLTAKMDKFGRDFFSSAGVVAGVIEHPTKPSDEAVKRLEETFNKAKGRGIRVLTEGLTYKPTNIPPEDAQLLDSRIFQLGEIARIFGVPLILLNEHSKNTSFGKGIEHTMIGFVKFTLQPLIVHLEEELSYKLFQKDEDFQIKFNVSGFERGDTASRGDFYTKMHNIGVLSSNDIRKLEDLPPYEGGDTYYHPMNMEDNSKTKNNQEQ